MNLLYKISPILFFILLLLLWEFIPLFLKTPIYVFPRISDIYSAVYFARDVFMLNIITTLSESILGFILGSSIGFITGIIMAEQTEVNRNV